MKRIAFLFITVVLFFCFQPVKAKASLAITGHSLDYYSFGPVSGNKPKQLFFLLHGLHGEGLDLLWLAQYFSKVLPDALFILPNAPYEVEDEEGGYQWYTPAYHGSILRGWSAKSSYPILDQFITEMIDKHEVSQNKIILSGFSQGGSMSLYVGLRRDVMAIVSFSGRLIGGIPNNGYINKKRVVLLHGSDDDVVPIFFHYDAITELLQSGVETVSYISSSSGHDITDDIVVEAMFLLYKTIYNR
jgi:phospholipase/carboxylesterase